MKPDFKRTCFAFLLLTGCVSDVSTPSDGGTSNDSQTSDAIVDDQKASDQSVPMTDVNGTVVDEFGNPTPNAAVRIGTLTTTTDAMGKFTLKADPTYRIDIVHDTSTTSSGKRVLVLVGLTTRTPQIQTLSSAARTATVNLTVSGLGSTIPAGMRVYLWTVPTSKTNDGAGGTLLSNDMTMKTYSTKWQGATPIAGNMTALYLTFANNAAFPTAFSSYGTTVVSIAGGATQAVNVNGAGTTIAGGATVSGTIAYNGGTGVGLQINYRPSGIGGLPFGALGYSMPTFSIPMPNIFTWRSVVTSVALMPSGAQSYAWKVGLQPNASGVALAHGSDLVPTAPNDAAAMVDASTTFTWPAQTNASYLLNAYCGSVNSPTAIVDVLTTSTSASIPDTASLGSGLPSNAACKWTVSSFGSTGKIDDLVGPAGWQRSVKSSLADADNVLVQSKERQFTPK